MREFYDVRLMAYKVRKEAILRRLNRDREMARNKRDFVKAINEGEVQLVKQDKG